MFIRQKKIINQSGFTLVETLITLVVFSVGLLAIYTLSITNLNATRDNYRRTLSANLAREAVELIRNQRDSNWLAIDANEDCGDPSYDSFPICTWDYGLTSDYAIVSFENQEPTSLACSSFEDCLALEESNIYFYNNGGEQHYTHVSGAAKNTGIKRVVRLQAICRDTSTDLAQSSESLVDTADCDIGTKIGVLATVRAQWNLLGRNQFIDIAEKIYNWR